MQPSRNKGEISRAQSRFQKLTLAVNKAFSTQLVEPLTIDDLEMNSGSPRQSIHDMYIVLVKSGSLLRLVHCFDDTVILAILDRPDILRFIQPGDSFLFYLISDGAYWRVTHMSPPYETEDISVDPSEVFCN